MNKILYGFSLLILSFTFSPLNDPNDGTTIYESTHENFLGDPSTITITIPKGATKAEIADFLCQQKYLSGFLKRMGYECA